MFITGAGQHSKEQTVAHSGFSNRECCEAAKSSQILDYPRVEMPGHFYAAETRISFGKVGHYCPAQNVAIFQALWVDKFLHGKKCETKVHNI